MGVSKRKIGKRGRFHSVMLKLKSWGNMPEAVVIGHFFHRIPL